MPPPFGGLPRGAHARRRAPSAVPAPLAALANGIAGHALDWDDTAMSLTPDRTVLIHPTMQPLCAVLALGDLLDADGRTALTAFVLGFEVQVKIAEAMDADHFVYGRGYHTTGTIGVFGATVAAARMMGLDAAPDGRRDRPGRDDVLGPGREPRDDGPSPSTWATRPRPA